MRAWLGGIIACFACLQAACAIQPTAALDAPTVTPLKGSVGSLGVPPARKSAAKSNGVLAGDRMTCKGLENAIDVHISKLVALKQLAKVESEQPAPTLERAFVRMFGSQGADNKALSEITIEQNQLEHYNSVLLTKGCVGVDISAKLAAARVSVPASKPEATKLSSGKM